jgi:hypothetical protein
LGLVKPSLLCKMDLIMLDQEAVLIGFLLKLLRTSLVTVNRVSLLTLLLLPNRSIVLLPKFKILNEYSDVFI